MWSRKLIKNKIYAVLIILLGALSVPIEWDATFFSKKSNSNFREA